MKTKQTPALNEDAVVTNTLLATPPPAETPPSFVSKLRFSPSMYHYAGVLVGIFVVALAIFLYTSHERHVAIKQFTNVYSFVPEKISKSAPIQINVPDGVDESAAQAAITFSPAIAGTWQTEDVEKVIIFQPQKPLRVGVYYAVNLDTGTVQMSGDFYVDEDPKIEAIFPASGSESHEDSEITIVFNRPMVPLTTLTELKNIDLPISITPATPGTFKWISTRNLQFIPETTLFPASEYTVEIKSGLISMDGLPVAPLTHQFITRPLRYEYVSDAQIGYRSPIIVRFNQPVDLEATKRQLTVSNNNSKVAIEVDYGEITYYDAATKKQITKQDLNTLYLYQRKDKHGRSRLWDFETTYTVSITGASPLFGTKNLTEGNIFTVTVPSIIQNVVATSDRSEQTRPDLFDPRGTLAVTFYDDVSIQRSTITAKGLTAITYGERCKTDQSGTPIALGSGCEKEDDTKTLIITFAPEAFGNAESFGLTLKKVVTPDGFSITSEPITVPLKTFPTPAIIKTIPSQQATAAALDGMYVCSNTPLKHPGDAGLASYISTTGYIVFGRWSASQYIEKDNSYYHCSAGQFQTNIRYGLLPETNYQLQLSLTDEFDQTATTQVLFKTEVAKEQYTRFHNLQKRYNVTTPTRTTLTYAAENLEYLDLHICKMEPDAFLNATINQPERTTPPSDAECITTTTKRIDLPVRYWVNNYFQVDIRDHFPDPRGHYILTFGNPLYTSPYENKRIYDRTYVSVTNLAVGKKEIEYYDYSYSTSKNKESDTVRINTLAQANNLYWINHNQSLTPITSASVTQYERTNDRRITQKATGYSNATGIASVAVEKNIIGAVVRSGLDTAIITDWADVLGDADIARDASRTYVYTDRPIYRPGHTVHIRGIDRIGFDGSYEIAKKVEVPLQIFDSQGNNVYEVALAQSDYGTFATDFQIPSDAPLGTYDIMVLGQRFWFAVEEYVPAAFKLEATANKEEFINGDTMKIALQADYYFGVPLNSGTVSYSVTAQDYHFDRYTDEYFNFGQSWYYCYFCGYGDDFLFRGETTIDASGKATIERTLNFDDYFDDSNTEGSKLITVFLTAKDSNGRSVSTQKSFIVHKGEFYIGAKTDRYYTSVNTPLTLRAKTVDTTGQKISLTGIEKIVYKVHWETFKRQEVDGGFYYHSEKKRTEVSREQIASNSSGDWNGPLRFAEEGQYEVHLRKNDSNGNTITTTTSVYIYGTASVTIPPNNNYSLDLEVEQASVAIGDTASLLIKSPYENAKVLIAVERGTVYDYWIQNITGGLYLHEFPIKSEYAPNIFVSVLLLSSDPEVKYGSVRYDIGTAEKKLSIAVTANKQHYLPGETVTLSVETKDHTGAATPAEVSLAVADLSVLALKGNPKKNPALFFYDGFPLSVTTASNIKNILYKTDIPLGTKGGDGANPDDLAKKQRGVFKDTAFWAASVHTDQNGKATVSFTLPDNLTTWQIEGLGVTKDTKLGVTYSEFTTKKDLMAVPLKPRFIIPGDHFSLGSTVYNQTDRTTTVEVTLESDTLEFKNKKSDAVSLRAGEAKTIYFPVRAPAHIKAGSHSFTFTAKDNSFTDSVVQTIPITTNTTYETVATAHFTQYDRSVEYLYVPDEIVSGDGGLTINANATLAVFMVDALSYMVTYPYGCSEQLASALSTIGTIKKALTLPNVEGSLDTIQYENVTYTTDEVIKKGVARIYEMQTPGGGFSYYKGLEPDLSLTMHVVDGLATLKEVGYNISDATLKRALSYIETETRRAYAQYPSSNQETVIVAEYTLRRANGNTATPLTPLVTTFITDKVFINEKISSMTLAYLALLTATDFSRSQRTTVYTALQNRIDIDGRGAYLKSMNTTNTDSFETAIKNTALLLKAFTAYDDKHPALANTLRWLLASRDYRGVWGSTHNTFVVVDAMVDYLNWQKETESRFSLTGILDGVTIFGTEFTPATIFNTFTHFIPTDALPKAKLIPLVLEKTDTTNKKSNFYYDLALKYFLPTDKIAPRDEGITIARELYALTDTNDTTPVTSTTVGSLVKGKITLTIPRQYAHVSVADTIPAGFEIINFNIETEDQSLKNNNAVGLGGYRRSTLVSRIASVFGTSQTAQLTTARSTGGSYRNITRRLSPTHSESHDDQVFLYIKSLPPGVYEYEYFLRAQVPGEFQHLPARAEQLFFPEVFGRTDGRIITVTPAPAR